MKHLPTTETSGATSDCLMTSSCAELIIKWQCRHHHSSVYESGDVRRQILKRGGVGRAFDSGHHPWEWDRPVVAAQGQRVARVLRECYSRLAAARTGSGGGIGPAPFGRACRAASMASRAAVSMAASSGGPSVALTIQLPPTASTSGRAR
mmetsp:Transcript_20343/g.52516  ORF Transcript_20343/g.52516 Transcript_20343/m.52516 type:complete len:150 (-) Transcript_20343:309-758(-)